jgi:hypothetical protein
VFGVVGSGCRALCADEKYPEPDTQHLTPGEHRSGVMSEHGKCPMGNHPWLATFFVFTFLLVFLAHKLGLL